MQAHQNELMAWHANYKRKAGLALLGASAVSASLSKPKVADGGNGPTTSTVGDL